MDNSVNSVGFSVTRYFKKALWIYPLIGGCIGILGGIAGILIGILLGYILSQLFWQSKEEKRVLQYLIHPHGSQFHETEPGMAAYCALGIIVASQSDTNVQAGNGKIIIQKAAQNAASAFPHGTHDLIVSYCRIAYTWKLYLKLDTLVNNLISRRKNLGERDGLGRHLQSLASGEEAQKTTAYIYSLLNPQYQPDQEITEKSAADPWQVLGLKPGVSMEQVNAQFRKLATDCYPNTQENCSDLEKTEAFSKMKEAYRHIIRQNTRLVQ